MYRLVFSCWLFTLVKAQQVAVQHTVPNSNATAAYCPVGWSSFGEESCVRLFNHPQNWIRAEETCRTYNSHLVTVNSIEDWEEIKELGFFVGGQNFRERLPVPPNVQQPGKRRKRSPFFPHRSRWRHWSRPEAWLGLGQMCPRNIGEMPDFKWADGSVLDEKFFTEMMPKNLTDVAKSWKQTSSLCFKYSIEGTDNHTWKAVDCSEQNTFFCQRQALGIPRKLNEDGDEEDEIGPKTNYKTHPCGSDPRWCVRKSKDGNFCYRIIDKLHYWEDALDECQVEQSADLASIHSVEELNFIANMTHLQPFSKVAGSLWIGLNRLNFDKSYRWSDTTPLDYMASFRNKDQRRQGSWWRRFENPAGRKSDDNDGSCTAFVVNKKNGPWNRHMPFQINQTVLGSSDQNLGGWKNKRCDRRLPAVCKRLSFDSDNPVTTTPKPLPKDGGCNKEKGWEHYDKKCYKFMPKEEFFDDAKKACQKENANLVSIGSVFEQAYILSKLKREEDKQNGDKVDIWLGMTIDRGRMEWIDESRMSYSRFFPSNRVLIIGPNQRVIHTGRTVRSSNQACTFLDGRIDVGYWHMALNATKEQEQSTRSTEPDADGVVTSYTCNRDKLPFICEAHTDENVKNAPDHEKEFGNCNKFNDSCYYFYRAVPKEGETKDDGANGFILNWELAKGFCAAATTHNLKDKIGNESLSHFDLLSIRNKFEWSYVISQAKQLGMQEFWLGLKEENGTFTWSDGFPLEMNRWGQEQPLIGQGHHCVSMVIDEKEGASWYSRNCNAYLPIVCKGTYAKPPKPKTKVDMYCPASWTKSKNRCYKAMVSHDKMTTGYRAQHECFTQFGSQLASFPSQEDFQEVVKHLTNSDNKFTVRYAYIGLVQLSEGGYSWTDNSPLRYVNWAPGQPKMMGDPNDKVCVQMELRGNYSWSDVSCWQTRHFICSHDPFDQEPIKPTGPPPTTITTGPPTEPTKNTEPTKEPPSTTVTVTAKPDDKKAPVTPELTKKQTGKPTKVEVAGQKKVAADSSGGSTTAIIIVVLVLVVLVSIVGVFIYLRRRGAVGAFWSRRQPGIMRFDQLTSEEGEI